MEETRSSFLEEIELADQVGLDVFGVGEHHRPDFVVSSPAVVLAAAAERTRRIRLTSAVTVLSSDDPLRVFQDFATLSDGRPWMRKQSCSPTPTGEILRHSGMKDAWKRPVMLFWRAVRLRCPNCGGGPLFSGWIQMRVRCPDCRLRLERGEEGYQVGSYLFNIMAAELSHSHLANASLG